MKTIRIIPRLDVKGPNLVKGIHLEGLRVLGLPERFSYNYFLDGADELIYIDAVASLYGRNNLEEIVRITAESIFIPITVGGGIRSVDDMRRLLRAGADKVAINTIAISNPQLISEGAKVFGSQSIIVSIQAMKISEGKYEAYTDNGREPSGRDAIEWAKQAVDLGAGEILITSIDQDGTGNGYDLELISKVVEAVAVPVIACGGAGCVKHVEEVVRKCNVDAISAASIFHYQFLKKFGVEKRKEGNVEYLKEFVEGSGSVLKRINPVSVSDLKAQLNKSNVFCVNSRLTDEHNERMSDEHDKAVPSVVFVDYGRSNLFSVESAFNSIGSHVEITSDPKKIANADRLVLAGVGAFGDGMKSLQENGLVSAIKEYVSKGKPILGVCLGMQLFMTEGEEFGFSEGLDLIKGRVVRLKESAYNGQKYKIPHIGWNQIKTPKREEGSSVCHSTRHWQNETILNGIPSGKSFYFVHSYVVVPDDAETVIVETDYGENRFCSIIKRGSVIGCQFHPEKSGTIGLQLLRNFLYQC